MAYIKFNFPAKKEEIETCTDINLLKEWQKKFEEQLTTAEFTFGQDFDEAPEKLKGYLKANEWNLRQIKWKIRTLEKPIEPIVALKKFYDTVCEHLENDKIWLDCDHHMSRLEYIKKMTLKKLGKPNEDFDEMIKPKKYKK